VVASSNVFSDSCIVHSASTHILQMCTLFVRLASKELPLFLIFLALSAGSRSLLGVCLMGTVPPDRKWLLPGNGRFQNIFTCGAPVLRYSLPSYGFLYVAPQRLCAICHATTV
jgi:hypothetical protein